MSKVRKPITAARKGHHCSNCRTTTLKVRHCVGVCRSWAKMLLPIARLSALHRAPYHILAGLCLNLLATSCQPQAVVGCDVSLVHAE